jgi:tetratricopeptide (TPR) repeat protein
MRTERYDSAIQAFQAAKKLAQTMPEIDLNLGLAYYHKQEFAKAIPEFSQVVLSRQDDYQARYLLGISYFMEDDCQHATDALEPLAGGEKKNLDFLFVQGICYGKLKREKESEEVFGQLVRVGGDTAYLHLLLGKAYLDLYENQHAITELRRCISLGPKLGFAHFNLGVAYQRIGMLQEARKEFDTEMTITPQEPWSYENRGEVCLDLGQTDAAVRFFRLALARRPRLPKSLAGLGKAYIRKGQTAQGIRYLKDAIAIEPGTATFHYQLGQAYLKAGEREEAKQEMATAENLQAAAREKQAEQLSGRLPSPPLPAQEP